MHSKFSFSDFDPPQSFLPRVVVYYDFGDAGSLRILDNGRIGHIFWLIIRNITKLVS